MNSLTGIFLIVLSFSAILIFANDPYEDDSWAADEVYEDSEFKEKVKNKSTECAKSAQPDALDLYFFFTRDMCGDQPQAKPSTRCWISCIMNKMNILNVVKEGQKRIGMFDRVGMKKNVEEMKGGPDSKSSLLHVLETCAQEAEQGSRNPCEMGYELLRCYCRKLQQNKPKKAPRQDEVHEDHHD